MDAEWIILIVSTGALIVGAGLWIQSNRLRLNGRKCVGTIIKNNFESSRNGGMYYPLVRFVTEEKLWITKQLNVGSKPAMREGKQVKIIYNVDDPYDFQLDSIFLLDILPRLLVVLGITGIAYGLMMYLGYV